MLAPSFEQHMDRWVELGYLDVSVLVQRTVVLDRQERTHAAGTRVDNSSHILMKVYTVKEGVEGIFADGKSFDYFTAGDQIELNGTTHNAYGTGFTWVRNSQPKESFDHRRSMPFRSLTYDFAFRHLPQRIKKGR